MPARLNPVEALVTLPRLDDAPARIASWRQAITALSQSAGLLGPPPLDGVDPDMLERAAELALDTGLADELDWIAPGSAAVALYELTAALPQGRARRELGRRVYSRIYEGTAATFAAVAGRMALGNAKPLDTPALAARVNLVVEMPIGSSVNADRLASTLLGRRDLREHWFDRPSMGALPARRLAASLLELAAREAMTRAQLGDPQPKDLLLSDELKPTFSRLLADREPLVWQRAATARGLLSTVDGRVRQELEAALDPSLSPTEWRRATVAWVAALVSGSEEILRGCTRIMEGELVHLDPGIVASMVMGLPRVIEAEPDIAEELLDRMSLTKRADVAETVAALYSDMTQRRFAEGAAAILRNVLADHARDQTSVLRGIAARSMRLLDPEHVDESSVHEHVRRALLAFDSEGARQAFDLARQAVREAHGAMDFIEVHRADDEAGMPALLGTLADLDASVLERSRLASLMVLGRKPGESDASVPELERLYHRLGNWILSGEDELKPESDDEGSDGEWSHNAVLAGQRRLRTLLHLVDLDTAEAELGGAATSIKRRVLRSIQVLIRRLSSNPDGMVHRIVCATLARSFDAAVREGVAEPSDLVLLVAARLDDNHSVQTIAEASTNPDVSTAIAALSRFMDPNLMDSGKDDPTDTHTEPGLDPMTLSNVQAEDAMRVAKRVSQLSFGLSAGGSFRGEALRRTAFRLGRALESIASARGLTDLVDNASSQDSALDELENACEALRQMAISASRRLMDDHSADIAVVADVPSLPVLIERAVRNGIPANSEQLGMAVSELVVDLPGAIAMAIEQVLTRVADLPIAPPSDVFAIPLEKRRAPLPDWLLPRRTIGAFYVVRALGSGGVSSVFVVRRIEERRNVRAESFALKVPQYDPTTARSLSEQEFLQLFREEAGALLSLPQHPNLARFVTFDLAARPKPILVMELIRGIGLDRLIRSRSLTTERAFDYLDGILAGLEAMHQVGVGHLDIKPSNVIMRRGETPVLVDFGLSGRQLRPGCGTLEYCSPEILGIVPEGHQPSPLAADVYAFACLAYEVLTGELLFDADDEMTLVSRQVSHDGWPPQLTALAQRQAYSDVAVVLAACLRRDPRLRPSASDTRAALAQAARAVQQQPWPLAAPEVAEISA